MRSYVLAALAGLALMAGTLAACAILRADVAYPAASAAPADGPPIVLASACAEDARCWHWPTMGNRMRGYVVLRRTGYVARLTPCAFRRAWRSDRIDRRRTPRMRGDRWAIDHGCSAPHASAGR